MMRKCGVAATAALLAGWALSAVPAEASGIELRMGASFPSAKSDLFRDTQELFGTEQSDWIGFTGGIEFDASLSKHIELAVAVDGYGRRLETSYVDFVRPNGGEIFQTLKLDNIPLSLSVRLLANNSRGSISPYVLFGGNAYFWQYREEGDFIDFQDPGLDISYDSFESDGVAFGLHVGAGVRVPLGDDFSLTAEGRYHFADEVDMDDDFNRNRIDLSGFVVTVGGHLRF